MVSNFGEAYGVGNLGSGLGHGQKCGRINWLMESQSAWYTPTYKINVVSPLTLESSSPASDEVC